MEATRRLDKSGASILLGISLDLRAKIESMQDILS